METVTDPASVSFSVRPEVEDSATDPLPTSVIASTAFAVLDMVTETEPTIISRIAAEDVRLMLPVPAMAVILERFAVLEIVTELDPTIRSRIEELLESEMVFAPPNVIASDKPALAERFTDPVPANVIASDKFALWVSAIVKLPPRLLPPEA